MGTIALSEMEDPTSWESPYLEQFLAEQLVKRRVALILGAGASFGFGLPTWDLLTDRLLTLTKCVGRSAGRSNEALAEDAWYACHKDEEQFAALVRKALYQGYVADFESLTSHALMRALGALAMPSSRGYVSKIVTFNFDDLLETYLKEFGVATDSEATQPMWQSQADVSVLHQHGILPVKHGESVSRIVMTRTHFDLMANDVKDSWKRTVVQIMASHTCIFIGLSGDDQNLRLMLADAKSVHVSRRHRHLYWGVRFTVRAENHQMWLDHKVAEHKLVSYDELPPLLLRICQLASQRWRSSTE